MKGIRRQICVCALGGVLLSSYLPYKNKKYAEYFFQKCSAELFREQRFNLQTLRLSYDNQSITHVVMRFTCFRSLDLINARKLLIETVRDIVEKAGKDKMLNRYHLVNNGHLCIPNLEIEIKSDCYLSEAIDSSFIKCITLENGMITYETYKISPTTSTGREYIKESYRDAVMLSEEKNRPDIALEISDFKREITREKVQKRKAVSSKVTWEEGTSIPSAEEEFKAVVKPVEENVPLTIMTKQRPEEVAPQGHEEEQKSKVESKEPEPTTPAPTEEMAPEAQAEKTIQAIPMTPVEEFSEEKKESEEAAKAQAPQAEQSIPEKAPATPEKSQIPVVPSQACDRLYQMELTPVETYSSEDSPEGTPELQQEKDRSIKVEEAAQSKVTKAEETKVPEQKVEIPVAQPVKEEKTEQDVSIQDVSKQGESAPAEEKKGFFEKIKSYFWDTSSEKQQQPVTPETVKKEEIQAVVPQKEDLPHTEPVQPAVEPKIEENKVPEAPVEQPTVPVENTTVESKEALKVEESAPVVPMAQEEIQKEPPKVEENKVPEAPVEQPTVPVENTTVESKEALKVEEAAPVVPMAQEEIQKEPPKVEEQITPETVVVPENTPTDTSKAVQPEVTQPIPAAEVPVQEITPPAQESPADLQELPLSEEEVRKILESIPDVAEPPIVEETPVPQAVPAEEAHMSEQPVNASHDQPAVEESPKPETTPPQAAPSEEITKEVTVVEEAPSANVQEPEIVSETQSVEKTNKDESVEEIPQTVTPASKEDAQNATQDFIKRMWSSVWKATPAEKQEDVAVEEKPVPQDEQTVPLQEAAPVEEAPAAEGNSAGGAMSQNFDEPAPFLQYPYPPAIVSDVDVEDNDSL